MTRALFTAIGLCAAILAAGCETGQPEPTSLSERVEGGVATSQRVETGIFTQLTHPDTKVVLATLEWTNGAPTARFTAGQKVREVTLNVSPTLTWANRAIAMMFARHGKPADSPQAYGCFCDYAGGHGTFCCCDYGIVTICSFSS